MKCRICKKEVSANDIRFMVCWDCAQVESIIEDGTDMYDEGTAKTSMDKLEYLIAKGWKK